MKCLEKYQKEQKEYADSVLAGIEVALQDAMKVIQNNRKRT